MLDVDLQLLSTVHMPGCSFQLLEVHVHLGAMERGVGRAAAPPLRAEPVKLRGGMWDPFGAALAEVGGEDCTLELSDSSLCSMSRHVKNLPTFAFLAHIGGWGWGARKVGAVCHVAQTVGYQAGWHTAPV